MSYRKWLITTLSLMLMIAALVVAVNFFVDHHAIRLSLFSVNKEIRQMVFPDGINQHTFNPEFIFRNPEKFDAFLFGSSRTAVIQVDKIPAHRFYNMSYSLGLPAQHLAILRAFLKKGIKIKAVVIGLDEFCFNLTPATRQKHLIRIMHPDAGGPSRAEMFGMYFFRKPGVDDLAKWRDRVLYGKMERRFIMNNRGVNLSWREKDRIIENTGKPIFNFTVRKYEPIVYGPKEMDEAFAVIEELIALSRMHHFSITFFITPFYSQVYLNNAKALLNAKERLAMLTDYYDFSGFNSVTTNAINYYEESHYRYRVGDMMIERMFGGASTAAPDDFGVRVTRQNVRRHLESQKFELAEYLKVQHLQ
jgi:hypothetical protein